jgi:hypothetical protein
VGFVVYKVAPGQVFSEYFGFPIQSTKFSILTITRGRYNRPINGRRAEWTQFGFHPPLCKLKKKDIENLAGCTPDKVGKISEWSSILNSAEEYRANFSKDLDRKPLLALSTACTR